MPFDPLGGEQTGLSSFGPLMRKAIEQGSIAENLRPHRAIGLWPQIAGEQIAAVSEAEAVRGNVLFVRTKSSAWANELTFYKPEMLKNLALQLGGRVIEDIHFNTGGSPARKSRRKPAAEDVAKIVDLRDVVPAMPPSAAISDKSKLDALVQRTQSLIAWKRENGWHACRRCDALYEPPQATKNSSKALRARQEKSHGLCPACVALMNR